MKVGIIVHSQSGHTAFFVRMLAEKFKLATIEYDIELLRTQGATRPFAKKVSFRRLPDISSYDFLLFGSPVIALNASPVMVSFIKTLDSLKGKRALPFVTYGLPVKWLGAHQALETMTRKLDVLCADILEGESIFFFFSFKTSKMEEIAQRIVTKISQTP